MKRERENEEGRIWKQQQEHPREKLLLLLRIFPAEHYESSNYSANTGRSWNGSSAFTCVVWPAARLFLWALLHAVPLFHCSCSWSGPLLLPQQQSRPRAHFWASFESGLRAREDDAGHMIITEEPTAWCEVRTKETEAKVEESLKPGELDIVSCFLFTFNSHIEPL